MTETAPAPVPKPPDPILLVEAAMQRRTGATLKPYQRIGIRFLAARRQAGCFDDPGLGKTVEFLGALTYPDPVILVCPGAVKGKWAAEFRRWRPEWRVSILEGTKWFRWPNEGEALILNYEIIPPAPVEVQQLIARATKARTKRTAVMLRDRVMAGTMILRSMAPPRPRTVVGYDECFVAGTRVATPSGNRAIEEVERGDVVLNAAGAGKVSRVVRRTAERLVKVTDERGLSFVCTIEHRVLTWSGWRMAGELAASDALVSGEAAKEVLDAHVRVVQGGVPEQAVADAFLRDILLGEVEDSPTWGARLDPYPGKSSSPIGADSDADGQREPARHALVAEDARAQPHAGRGRQGAGEGRPDLDRPPTDGARRERYRAHEGGNCGTGIAPSARRLGLRDGVRDSDILQEGFGVPCGVQGGRCGALAHAGDRGGRCVSPHSVEASPRREEGRIPRAIRVACVEALESGHPDWPGGTRRRVDVYDLTVEGHPSYVVNGLVVHNCHRAKNPETKTALRVREMSGHVLGVDGRAWELSGTPLENRPEELYSVLQAVGLGTTLFGNIDGFHKAWCAGTVPEILRKGTIRRLRADVLPDLPPKTFETIPVKLDDETRDYCDRLVRAFQARGYSLRTLTLDALRRAAAPGDAMAKAMSAVRARIAALKIGTLLELVADDEAAGTPLVVFSSFRAPVDVFARRPRWTTIHGGISSKEATKRSMAFQEGEYVGVAGTYPKMREGIDLYRAWKCIVVDRPWTWTALDQAMSRLCRIGQTAKGLLYVFLEADHPIERRVNELVDEKKIMAEVSVDASARRPG